MTLEEVDASMEYMAARLAVELMAAFDDNPMEIEFEQPHLCEDGKSYSLRAWTKDDRSYEIGFEPSAAGSALALTYDLVDGDFEPRGISVLSDPERT